MPGSLENPYKDLRFNAITSILYAQEISIVNKIPILLIFLLAR
jgi:hypothetical protein